MKKKIFIMIAAVMIFGLAIAVYAYNSTLVNSGKAKTSCCSGDSCPMTKDAAHAGEKTSCCDDCACCKDGKCSMKSDKAAKADHGDCCKKEKTSADGATMKMGEGESCPMMKDGSHKMKEGDHKTTAGHEAKAEHSGCCCPCCGTKEKKTDTTV